jgi:hypothetical protein
MGCIIYVSGLLTGLITNTSILVIYLTLIVVFFLLGLTLGLTIQTRRRIPKDTRSSENADPLNRSRQTFVPGQDGRERADRQISPAASEHRHSRHRRHRHSSIHIQ